MKDYIKVILKQDLILMKQTKKDKIFRYISEKRTSIKANIYNSFFGSIGTVDKIYKPIWHICHKTPIRRIACKIKGYKYE